ncbi:MAG: 2-dehydropantoate 2-reductase [Candidatus Lokiarchaeota archaeon]|nr:2-dehydropantoate 2-reductase [Candidatus Lokiarchaeota archaeon]
MSLKHIKIGIIGAGSIGSLFGGYLANIKSIKYRTDVILFGRKNHIEMINQRGLSIIKDSEKLKINGIRAFTNIKSYQKEDKDFDYIFLSTKAYDIESTLSEYSEILADTKWLVILQNGIGNEDIAKNFFPELKIIRLITSHGAILTEPGKVKHTGQGFTKIGFPFREKILMKYGKEQLFSIIEELRDLLNLAKIKTNSVEDIEISCWEKVFVNIGINAFGTLSRLRNGQLLEIKELKSLMKEVIEEAIQVAKFKNIKIPNNDYVALSYDVAIKTKNNINSMLQDILKGKKTEIDFLNGKIVQYANELGIKVPINKTLTFLIKGLERSEF